MTQGDPLSMIAYGFGFLPQIKHLKLAYPDVPHPWYADNDGALGEFDILERYYNSLKCHGLAQGITQSHQKHYDFASEKYRSGGGIWPVSWV